MSNNLKEGIEILCRKTYLLALEFSAANLYFFVYQAFINIQSFVFVILNHDKVMIGILKLFSLLHRFDIEISIYLRMIISINNFLLETN